MPIETSGDQTMTTPTGWAHVTGSPLTDDPTLAGSKLHVFWKRATSAAEPDVVTDDSGDHQVGQIHVFRGCVTSGNPWDVIASNVKTTASTTATFPTVTTTVAETLIALAASRPDDSSSVTHFGVPVNAALTGLAEAGEAGTTGGNGGGTVLGYGTKATAGVVGTTTMTKTVSTTDVRFTIALRSPIVAPLEAALSAAGTLVAQVTTGVFLDAALTGTGTLAAAFEVGGAAALAAVLSGNATLAAALFTADTKPYWSVLVRWDGTNWDEVGPDVRQISWQRGSSGDFGSMEPGTFTLRLQNSADRYLPTNPSSPLFGILRAGADVLIRCLYQGSYLRVAAGYVRSIKPTGSWLPSERMTEIVGDDALGAWNRRDVTLPAMRSGISIRDARSAVLDLLGLVGQRSIAEESSIIEYGELVVIRDDTGAELATFEAGYSGTPLQLLDALNTAGLGRHYIKPGTTTALPWQYVSIDRHYKLDAAADATMTYGTDYDDLDGWDVSDETRLSKVTVTPRQRDATPVEAVAGVAGANEATLSSDLMPSLAHAQGVADNLQWRFNAERPRPSMLLQRRLPQMFTRELFDVLSITDARYYLTARRMEIVGISGTWGPGPLPQVTWTLQDAPQQAPLTTFFTLGRDALGGPAVLGR